MMTDQEKAIAAYVARKPQRDAACARRGPVTYLELVAIDDRIIKGVYATARHNDEAVSMRFCAARLRVGFTRAA
jgi:hypothetical protein